MSQVVAVEVRGWDEDHWNVFPDSRDLTGWSQERNVTTTYTATGMSGLANTASVITDPAASPSLTSYVQSPTYQINDDQYVAARFFVLKDATSSPDPQFRIIDAINGTNIVNYELETSSGTLTYKDAEDPESGARATQRTFAGQDWWEVWLWGYTFAAQAAYIRIYPCRNAITDTRSITVGNVEFYQQGIGATSSSPEAGVWVDLDGTPPNYGDFCFASEAFTTELCGTYYYALFGDPYLPPVQGPANRTFLPRLRGELRYSTRVKAWPWGGSGSTSIGSIELANDDGALDTWREMEWRDRRVIVRLHDTDYDYLTAPEIERQPDEGADVMLRAVVERMEVVNESTTRLVLRDPVPELYEPMNETYAVNSPDTTPDANYLVTPIAFGNPMQCEPVLVDSSTFTYHLSDTTLTSVTEVYINGVEQSTTSPTYSASGQGFSLPAEASGRVTADPQSIASPDFDDLCDSISSRATVTFNAVTQTAINALNFSGTTYRYGYYSDSAITPAKVLDWACSSWGGWWWVDRLGEVRFGRLLSPDTLLENKLVNSYFDPRNLEGWEQSDTTTTYDRVGLDGKITASKLSDTSSNLGRVRTGEDLRFTPNTDPVCMRVWVKKDSTSSPDPVFRMSSENDIALLRYSMDTSTGSGSNLSSGSNTSSQVTLVNIDGVDWWELVVQADNDSSERFSARIYPASEAAAQTRGSLVIGGFEVYENATVSDVAGTPPNLTTSRVIGEHDIVSDVTIKPDHAPSLSDGAGANRNWSRGRTSEGTGLNADLFSREYQKQARSSNTLAPGYSHAVGANMPMSLIAGANAANIALQEANRMTALYQQERHFYTVRVGLDVGRFDDYIDQIGMVFQLQLDRYGLSSKNVQLVGVEGAFLGHETTLTFWG